ncbi:MAG: hypothetical protein KKA19_05085 [Candidatus Margulisbacteria bacterium]|nr:hypothetical protein [Candidatus Margulisiibacteriota bacterium]
MDFSSEFMEAPLWQKFLLVSLGLFLLFYFTYKIFYKDLFVNFRQTSRALQAIEQKIYSAKILLKDLPLMQQKELPLRQKLNVYLQTEKTSLSSFSYYVKKSGLNLIALKPITTEKNSLWTKHDLQIQLTGPLSAFQNFLELLYSSKLAFQIKNIQISSSSNNSNDISLSIDIYSLAPALYQKQIAKKSFPLTLQGFWTQGQSNKAFINHQLVGAGNLLGQYRVDKISPAEKYVLVKDIKTNRKYTLKVLK